MHETWKGEPATPLINKCLFPTTVILHIHQKTRSSAEMEKELCRNCTYWGGTATRWPAPPQTVCTYLQGNINSSRNYWMPPAHPKRHHQCVVSQQAQENCCWPITPWTAPSQPPVRRLLKLYLFLKLRTFQAFPQKDPGSIQDLLEEL